MGEAVTEETEGPVTEAELDAFHRVVGKLRALPVDDPVRLRAEQVAASFARDGRLRRRKTRGAERSAADAAVMAATATGAVDRHEDAPLTEGGRGGAFRTPRTCYVCKSPYRQVDSFYHRLCPACAADNTARRALSTDLTGRRVLLTGGRVKIGFQLALMMLRDGAEVLATSRFPHDTVRRFRAAPGSAHWLDRLTVLAVDLRDPRQVLGLCAEADLGPLLDWLCAGQPAGQRLDFAAGTALPDGRLDLCKQALGARGAALVAEALAQGPSPVRHLLLGTDALGDDGAATVAGADAGVETLYLGCNGITAGGACRIADQLRASPQVVTGVWLKRNPLGGGGGRAAAELIESARTLRTLDLVQTGLDPAGAAVLADALLAAAGDDRRIERLFAGGNPLGEPGAQALAAVVAAGAIDELYVSAARLGDAGALHLAEALERAPYGRLARLSVASNGIGPQAAARLAVAATRAGVTLLDLGRVRAAGVLGAADNRLDLTAASAIAEALAAGEHRLAHLVVRHTDLRSHEAHRFLDHAPHATTPTRFVLGQGIAGSVKRRLSALSAHIPPPSVPADVAAVRSVHRTATPED